jgi:hypothetical protein
MSAPAYRSRWLAWRPSEAGKLSPPRLQLPTAKTDGSHPSGGFDGAQEQPAPPYLADAGALAAVLLRGTVWGELWLIADDDVLADHPGIAGTGLPIVRFAELAHLERLGAVELGALGIVKRAFPTARVLQ